jgi:hypothetical protein
MPAEDRCSLALASSRAGANGNVSVIRAGSTHKDSPPSSRMSEHRGVLSDEILASDRGRTMPGRLARIASLLQPTGPMLLGRDDGRNSGSRGSFARVG